jgi:hypothetical protein
MSSVRMRFVKPIRLSSCSEVSDEISSDVYCHNIQTGGSYGSWEITKRWANLILVFLV